MSDLPEGYTAIEGEHFVTVPAGDTETPQFIGVKGLMKAMGPDSMVRVQFEGQSDVVELSAFKLIEFDQYVPAEGGAAAPAAPAAPAASGGDGGGQKIGIFFGTETGNTEAAAEKIRDLLSDCNITEFRDIDGMDVSEFLKHDILILGNSTWNIGDIQYSWEERLEAIGAQDYTGIKVAMFGLGDAAGYPDTFVDGLGILWDEMKDKGAELFGLWPTADYEFDGSRGLHDDNTFLGLVLDEDGEADKSDERIEKWVAQIRQELGLPAAG